MLVEHQECPVCGTDARVESSIEVMRHNTVCSACGEFVVTYQDQQNLRTSRERGEWKPAHVSALLREQSIRQPKFWLQDGTNAPTPEGETDAMPIDVKELVTRWPRTVPERIDHTLCNLARMSRTAGQWVPAPPTDFPLMFAETEEEARYHTNAMVSQKLLMSGANVTGHTASEFVLTPEGWSRFDKLTREASDRKNNVFVAMGFGDDEASKSEMSEVFKQIQGATDKAGYRAIRVDLEEHNEWIMDRVLGDIRLAPFVVADFTGHRNGVYFEAAFARGLGTTVINTCKRENLKKAHFDTAQLNHVLWDTPAELHKKLYYRILGTMGRGPHQPRSPSAEELTADNGTATKGDIPH